MNNGSLQQFTYSFDAATGNLTSRSRTNGNNTITESFTYDNLGRLTSAGGSAITYDTNNNIISMGGAGAMSYSNGVHPYTITDFDATATAGTAIQSIAYSAYDRPVYLLQGMSEATITYDACLNRAMMEYYDKNGDYGKNYYVGDRYEIRQDAGATTFTQLLYLGGDAYSAPMVLRKAGSGSWTPYVIGRDYLGSITHIATAGGTLVEERSYDAWGRLRDPATNVVYDASFQPTLFLGRGWCGHEYLQDYGLINMNARLYDPLVGRFLSPDPYIQAPDYPANFNRYSYCLNNPLKYTDESGEFIFSLFLGPVGAILDAACWGALIGGASYTASVAISNGGFSNWDSNDFWKAVGFGTLTGAAFGGIGEFVGVVGNFAGELGTKLLVDASWGVVNGLISESQGGMFWDGFAIGTLGALFNAPNTTTALSSLYNSQYYDSIDNLFFKLRRHYHYGHGEDYILTEKEFAYVISNGIVSETRSLYKEGLYRASIDFTHSSLDLHFSFGTASAYFDDDNNRVGFKDDYDFNKEPWGNRSTIDEIITRVYGFLFKGTNFSIYYNKSLIL